MRKVSVSKSKPQRKLLAGDAVSRKLSVGDSSSHDQIVDPFKVGKSWTAKQFSTLKPKRK